MKFFRRTVTVDNTAEPDNYLWRLSRGPEPTKPREPRTPWQHPAAIPYD